MSENHKPLLNRQELELESNRNEVDSIAAEARKNYFGTLHLINFVMALDFMIVFLTVGNYWVILNDGTSNSKSTISVIFATYNMGQVIAMPIVGYFMDKYPAKPILVITLILNILGNIIYSLAATWSSPAALVIGRVLTGIGSANAIIGSQFIVDYSHTTASRASKIASYNFCAFLGRVLGPMIAIGLLYIPDSNSRGIVIDSNTIPAWITALCGGAVLFLLLGIPSPAPIERTTSNASFYQSLMSGSIDKISVILFDYLLIMIVFWGWYPNITTTAFAQFHYAESYGSNSYLFLFSPIMIGITVGTKYVRKLLKSPTVTHASIALRGHILMLIAVVLLFDMEDGSAEWRYWVGGIGMCIGFTCLTSLLPSVYTFLVEEQGGSNHMGKYIALSAFLVAIGRTLGVVWTSPVLTVNYDRNCCSYHTLSGQTDSCCKLHGINTLMGILLALIVVSTVFAYFYLVPILNDAQVRQVRAQQLLEEQQKQEEQQQQEGFGHTSDASYRQM